MKSYIIIPTGENKLIRPTNGIDFKLEEVQKIVHGYVQQLDLPNGLVMLVDEEGQANCKLPNAKATKLLGSPICGTALVCRKEMFK